MRTNIKSPMSQSEQERKNQTPRCTGKISSYGFTHFSNHGHACERDGVDLCGWIISEVNLLTTDNNY